MRIDTFLLAAFRFLLSLHTRAVREEWGAAMELTFRERLRGCGGAALAREGVRELAGLALDVARERFLEARGAGRPARRLHLARLAHDLREASVALKRASPSVLAAVLLTGFAASFAGTGIAFLITRESTLADAPAARSALVLAGRDDERGWPVTHTSISNIAWAVERSGVFDRAAVFAAWPTLSWQRPGGAVPVEATFAEAAYFEILGAEPAAGRLFRDDETVESAEAAVALISHAVWTRWFGAEPAVAGAVMEIAGREYEVVGVLPARFSDAHRRTADVWLPLPAGRRVFGEDVYARSEQRQFFGIARLRPGVTVSRAETALAEVSRGRGPATIAAFTIESWLFDGTRGALIVLIGGGALIALLVLADLVLLRTVSHEEELRRWRIRLYLGAAEGSVVRTALAATTLVIGAGILAGAVAARTGVAMVRELIDWPDVGAPGSGTAGAILVGCALLVVLLPWEAMRVRRLLSGAVSSARRPRLQLLVAAQSGVAVTLLIAAGLTISSLVRLKSVELGFATDRLLTQRVDVSRLEAASIRTFTQRFPAAARSLAGVGSAGLWAPGMTGDNVWYVTVAKHAQRSPQLLAPWIVVSPGALDAAGIPLLEGRDIAVSDGEDSPCVVVLGRAIADALWPGGGAVGRSIALPHRAVGTCTVIGVAAESRQAPRTASVVTAGTAYFALAQNPTPYISVLVRGDGPTMRDDVAGLLDQLLPGVAAWDVQWMDDRIRWLESYPAFSANSSGAIALAGTLLALLGTYAVLKQMQRRRRVDLAVRQAVGATPLNTFLSVLRSGLGPVVAGAIAGLLVAWLALPLARPFVFGLESNLSTSVAATALFLLLAAVTNGATALDTARADPGRILREG